MISYTPEQLRIFAKLRTYSVPAVTGERADAFKRSTTAANLLRMFFAQLQAARAEPPTRSAACAP